MSYGLFSYGRHFDQVLVECGAVAHVGLTVDAPSPLMLKFKAKYYQETKTISDHNGIKGYTGIYVLKAAIEKAGKLDRKLVAQTMKGLTLPVAKYPGVLMDVSFDQNGDLDRESFMIRVENARQVVFAVVPAVVPAPARVQQPEVAEELPFVAWIAERLRDAVRRLARLGIVHHTTLPYSPEQNAKQEVFWAQIEGRLVPTEADATPLLFDCTPGVISSSE